jgi:ribulose-phosphate 3-epimerase
VAPDVAGQLAAAGANALVAGSAVFKGGTMDAYKANISAIRNAAALARGEAI